MDQLANFTGAWVEALRGVFPDQAAITALPRLPVTPETAAWINDAVFPQFGLVANTGPADALPSFAIAAAVRDSDAWSSGAPAWLSGTMLENDRALFALPPSYAQTAATFAGGEQSSDGVQLVRMETAPLADSLSAWGAFLRAYPDDVKTLTDHWLLDPEALDSLAALLRAPHRISGATFWENETLRRTFTLEPAP
jgi:hypothetical protein